MVDLAEGFLGIATFHPVNKSTSIIIFIAGGISGSTTADVSDLDKKLLKSSSLVSAPVFFVLGEPTERDVPEVVLILSAYVLRGSR